MESVGGYISVAEAARQLGVSLSYAYRLVGQGRLRSRRLGSTILVYLSSVQKFERRGRGRPRKTQKRRMSK